MILLIHRKATKVVEVLENKKVFQSQNSDPIQALWELAEAFPQELICWCEEEYYSEINLESFNKIFHHDSIMASYAVENSFLPETIGYVDQSPSININRKVKYGTWQMSSDVGGIKGEVLLKFQTHFGSLKDFGYLLNSVAKIGQQNSLFCYSEPRLLGIEIDRKTTPVANRFQTFSFVFQNYKNIWVFVLFWGYIKYEKEFPLIQLLVSFFSQKVFKAKVDLSEIQIRSTRSKTKKTIDVIIPTMGRPKYLYQVLKDLSKQTHPPGKVIVVEQNFDLESTSDLPFLKHKDWPFEVVHHFIHQTGACNARNIALEDVTSDWVFFADDDILFGEDLIENVFHALQENGLSAINLNCKQESEQTVFSKIKQWGSFGSGTSVVESKFAKQCSFLELFEHGYGEDRDYGMQLRNLGCDIVYHPNLVIKHLKAPTGGFREKRKLRWDTDFPLPKPSPTIMVYALRHYSFHQIMGYKMSLFLKYYNKQSIINPYAYLQDMRKRWQKSEEWAERLLKSKREKVSA